jgi:hypothetical protein
MTNTWKVEKVGNGTDPTLARVKFGPTINDDTWGWAEIVGMNAHAHANLIAAAPDLLEALKGIIEIGKRDMSNSKYDGYFESARAAIAKAVPK